MKKVIVILGAIMIMMMTSCSDNSYINRDQAINTTQELVRTNNKLLKENNKLLKDNNKLLKEIKDE